MVTFQPQPGALLTDLAGDIARSVVDLYAGLEAQLLQQVAARFATGLPEQQSVADQLAVIRELQDRAQALLRTGVPADLATRVVEAAAASGTAAAAEQLGLFGGVRRITDVTDSAVSTLGLIAQDLHNAFTGVHLRILRYPVDAAGVYLGTDVYQQVVASTVGARTVLGTSTDDVRKRTLEEFLSRGVTGFVDRSGRRWTLGAYTEMAVRTATQRAYTEASVHRMSRAGLRAVSILGNNDACPMCAPWFGKVLSIDGTPAGLYEFDHSFELGQTVEVRIAATLEEARAQGLMHPNCACTAAGYQPGFPVATSAPGYDPEAEAAAIRQRELERGIRELKRKLAAAEGMGNVGRADQLKAAIRDRQATLRAHVADTGRRRHYEREQVAWNGTGPAPRRPRMEPDLTPSRALQESPVRVPILPPDPPGPAPLGKAPTPKLPPGLPPASALFDATDHSVATAAAQALSGAYGRAGLVMEASMQVAPDVIGGGARTIAGLDWLVRNAEGRPVGGVTRTFTRHADGTIEVSHDMLMLRKEARGTGFATDLYRVMDEWYAQSGVSAVRVHASLEDGGYAWAKAGFDWAPEHIGGSLANVRSRLARIRQLESTSDADKARLQAMADRLGLGLGHPDMPTPFEVATLSGDDPRLGEKVMRGSEWHGIRKVRKG